MYYRKLKFQEKKYTLFTKKEDIENYNNLYYYCVNHRTTKTSKEEDNNGFKKRICICNSKIKYDKSNQKYIYCQGHSEECNNLVKEKFMNFKDIECEINNFDIFKKELTEYLKIYPVISFNNFKNYGINLYNKSEYEFPIPS